MNSKNPKSLCNNTWLKIVLVMIAFFVQFIAIGIIFHPHQDEFIKTRIASFLTKICMIIIACVFTKYIDKRNLDFLGIKFEKSRSLKLFGIGCFIVLIQLILIDGCAYFFNIVKDGSYKFSSEVLLVGILVFFVHTLFTGISEEMLFRGYILGNLLDKYSEFKAVIISALLFTVVHVSSVMSLFGYLDIFLAGVVFAYLYVITKSLYLPIGAHFFSDFIQEEIFRVEDVAETQYAVMAFNSQDSLIINGINFGPKIEILFIITQIIILICIYLYRNRRLALNSQDHIKC